MCQWYGIEKSKIEAIFAAFVTSKASTEGSGMGLFYAKKVTTRYGGKIWAESEGEGKGATFIVELPIAKNVTEEQLKEREFKRKRMF
jgi:signal transduction histidine kinase